MARDKDYRNTEYCPILNKVEEQKQVLEKEIKSEFPRTKIVYNKVNNWDSVYHKKFAQIYNNKCAYCGALWGLLPVESFEVDHFLNEASFPDTTEGRVEAGRMINLVWSCISCNRGKREITIKPPYDDLLNVDNGNIAMVFRRDREFYIRICNTYQNDKFIQQFYKSLHLGYETRRLDYLGLQLEGKYQAEKDEKRKNKLGECLSILMKERNRMVVTDGAL
ncbi:HNH endonuclease [Frisingicoccus sp.]|uniref:HNH endonuclease n=1 Tax=Frisingicoccus sp. TaxID=1918627 RepID=UPI003AB52DE2